jgi:pyruvate dehydrogenase E2 component (dihydrolipoamide acetyltransferase)
MPKLSPTMETGTIVHWLKSEGDAVRAGEVLFEVETDKAVMEVEAPDSGTLGSILVCEGEETPVLQVVGYLLEAGEKAPHTWPCPQASLPSPSAEPAGTQLGPGATDTARREASGLDQEAQTAATGAHHPRQASPRARSLAQEKGVSLGQISGSGPRGRIMERDVLEYLDSQDLIIPTRFQRVTGERMTRSFTTAPHFYLKMEVDASALVDWRNRLQPIIQSTSGVRLTFSDLFVLLVAQVLRKHPLVNASWEDGRIRAAKEINVGLAVAVEEGLVVPVLGQADTMTIAAIARRRETLVEKATAGTLGPESLEGGTFTLSNLGMLGIDEFAAILNPPQSAILAVGRIRERAVVENGTVVVRPTVHLVLSVDHRVLDGADAARFLSDLRDSIERAGDVLEESLARMKLEA